MPYAHRIDKPTTIRLADLNPSDTGGIEKDEAKRRKQELDEELAELEDLLFFAGSHSVLAVFQGMDTAGKDGAIRSLLTTLNVLSVSVASFKVPTPEELAHDFLWRCHAKAPGKGCITFFNRSHYEDVLVVRVHEIVPKDVWSARYERINEFESLLASSNTVILKFFLHIDSEEQEKRLLEREQETEKAWKLSAGDWKEREHWDAYQRAYEDAIGRCASADAPWFVVPANKKWFRDLAIAEQFVLALRPLRDTWMKRLEGIGVKAKAELAEYRTAATQRKTL